MQEEGPPVNHVRTASPWQRRQIDHGERDRDCRRRAPMRTAWPPCATGAASPLATLRAALVGNDREEHVFALAQALELYEVYQTKVAACDERIADVLERLKAASPPPAALPLPRRAQPQANEPAVPVRGPACDPRGRPDPDRWDRTPTRRSSWSASAARISRPGRAPSTSPPGWASRRTTRSPGARCCRPARAAPAAGSLPALLPLRRRRGTPRRAPRHALGALYRRLAARVGKAKAITATARKIAVWVYHTLSHGMA